jgi:putative peptidoglycan lipid II flippase
MPLTRIATRWNTWIARSPLRRMGHSALVAASTSLFARALGFAKEVVVASTFGLSGSLDVYLVAVVLIGVPVSILLNAAQTALIAHLSSGRLTPEEEANRFVTTSLLVLAVLVVLLPLWLWGLPFALPWLASGFAAEKREALEMALHWLIPYYFLNAFNLLGYGVLQAKGRYLANGLLPAATPVSFMLMLLARGGTDWKILVISLALGSASETLLLLGALYWPRLPGRLAMPRRLNIRAIRPLIHASLALLPGTIMLTVSPVVEQAIAAALGEGANATLAYGYKLPSALQSILVTAIGITALPYFARQLEYPAYCLHSLNKLMRWLMLGGVLLVLPLGLFSTEIIGLLYQRGAFDVAATQRVAPVQFAYFVQIPFALLAMLGMKAMAALGLNGRASAYTAFAVLIQVGLAYVLGIQYGPLGIALAATLTSALLAGSTLLTSRLKLVELSK